jgi:hypothetical protein
MIKIRAEINEMKSKRITQKISETKSWFFGKINKIDKPLAKLIFVNKECRLSELCYLISYYIY